MTGNQFLSICKILKFNFYLNWFRFALHKIEQELGTEIKPIPKVIDPHLYVAEYQTDSMDNHNENDSNEVSKKELTSGSHADHMVAAQQIQQAQMQLVQP